MSAYKFLILDSYPLGNAALSLDETQLGATEGGRCRRWMADCEANGTILIVPAICYYEEVRELYRRQATSKIARFQNFCFDVNRFLPLSSEQLTFAGQLWAQVRRTGQTTADPHSLDGDCILAAQVLSVGMATGDYAVVTRNPKHLTRLGLPAEAWENIAP